VNYMKTRYRLIRRGIRGNGFYCVDTHTRRRTSLHTTDEEVAAQLVEAKNISERQPNLNLQIAKAYLAGTDNGMDTRTWQDAFAARASTKKGPTLRRWLTAAKDPALASLMPQVLIETKGEMLLHALKRGKVSTNVFLWRVHNFCLRMGWLAKPLVSQEDWPRVSFKPKRAITFEEHCRIVEREKNSERKAFYELAWHLGMSQSDLANLRAENVNWDERTITYFRMKLRYRPKQMPAIIRFGADVEQVLAGLPDSGPLFPYLRSVREADRATEFRQRCRGLGIEGVTLHSYRYAWAERAATCAYPERFAQLALGHTSRAVHQEYAKKAKVPLPPLEDYERMYEEGKVIQLRRKKHVLPAEERPSEKDLATA
jgi:integrase